MSNDDLCIDKDIKIKASFTHGKHIAIDHGFYCTANLAIGNWIHIGPYCTVIGGKNTTLTMEDFTSMAAGCRFICTSIEHLGEGISIPFLPKEYKDNLVVGDILIKKFANVLTNAVIFPKVTIAEGSVISVGSVVTKDTEPWMIYAGIPARPIKERKKDKMIEMAAKLGRGSC